MVACQGESVLAEHDMQNARAYNYADSGGIMFNVAAEAVSLRVRVLLATPRSTLAGRVTKLFLATMALLVRSPMASL